MKGSSISFDIQSIRNGYLNNEFTVEEVVLESLHRIKSGDSAIWITVDSEENLLRQAIALEGRNPADLPLYGIPFAVKDNIDVANLPTTAACPDYKYFPENDATVVASLRAAGAIPIGKTNLDQFATGLVGVRSPYGVPGNAFDSDYLPGGSSSGSAVSVAFEQVSFSLGTDTAGSGRVPACYNNLVGLKPSRGVFSNSGLVPACKSLDCISVFALNCADAQTAFRAAKCFDETDPYSRPWPETLSDPKRAFREGMSFGVPEPIALKFFGNAEYQELYLQSIKRLESLGFVPQIIDFAPFLATARLLYEGPWVAERYWAIKDLIKNAPDSLHPTTLSIIEKGAQYSSEETFDAIYKLQALKLQAEKAWDSVDFLATPTAGTHYTIAEVEADPIQLNSNLGYYTNFMNLLDLSAVAAPTAFTSERMPFGITLIAPAFHDEKLLRIADKLHQASDLPLGASERKAYAPLEESVFDGQPIAVCGAHLSGLPLNRQLTDRGATLLQATHTSANYRLFALPGTTPPKPGMVRDTEAGAAIEIEIWNLPAPQWASFIESIPSPLGIGNIELEDGSWVKGFCCEAWATKDAKEITELGGWRQFAAQ